MVVGRRRLEIQQISVRKIFRDPFEDLAHILGIADQERYASGRA